MKNSFTEKIKLLIDELKGVCASFGLGNDGNEFKIITQVFLYKFLHDKFIKEVKLIKPELAGMKNWEEKLASYSQEEYELLAMQLNESTAYIRSEQTIYSLFKRQNESNFADIFDRTLLDIASQNNDIFSVITGGGEKITLFENISKYISDNRDEFCKAIINKLVDFSFENIFGEEFDFFATIFEYLIKDYNSDSGGKYAEYFTPHSVSGIMANCLVPSHKKNINNVSCYDPSAGSGTLLMNLAHQIGPNKCTVFSQDISQKSSNLLRLNLILNNLVHSIPNIIQGNTLTEPAHRDKNGALKKFDYIVANPPFKLNFADFRNELINKENQSRFFAGIPNILPKKKDSMAIYLVFLQHVISSLKSTGKAAIVVPTGFITAQKGIEKKIHKYLIKNKMLSGVISRPSNIFAKTGTNVSVLFVDKTNTQNVILIDASNLGEDIKDGKNQKRFLRKDDIDQIINTFVDKKNIDNFSTSVTYEELIENNCSLSAVQYFPIKLPDISLSKIEFDKKMKDHKKNLMNLFDDSRKISNEIAKNMDLIEYED